MMCKTCENLDSNANGLYCMVVGCSCPLDLTRFSCPYYKPNNKSSIQLKSVKWCLVSLNLLGSHVSLRNKNGYIGGGSVKQVISRYGDMLVEKSFLIDNVLVLFVV